MAQSFFDKLTGTIKVAQPQEPKVQPQSQPQPQEQPQPQPQPQIQARPSVSLPIQELKPKVETALQEQSMEEAGHSEVEGQLTVDVYQTPSEIVIKSTIAGVIMDDLDISMTNDMVTIHGERKKDEEVPSGDYFHQECYWGPFSRSIILPVEVEADRAIATFKNGILTIRLPKIEKVKARKIKISG